MRGKVVVEQFGLEEQSGLGEEGGQEQGRSEDVPHPTRKTTDGRRVMG